MGVYYYIYITTILPQHMESSEFNTCNKLQDLPKNIVTQTKYDYGVLKYGVACILVMVSWNLVYSSFLLT